MSHYRHSKSSLFLMELLIDLLFFCALCGCGLLFFVKSYNLTQDTTSLHQAVRITSSVASIYESGDGSFTSLCKEYEHADLDGHCLFIYFDEEYLPCSKEEAVYIVTSEQEHTSPGKIRIDFYDKKNNPCYSIRACNYTPFTLQNVKEVYLP